MLPKFVIKWIKDTSATGYFRMATNPNRRQQDGKKMEFLCNNCEQRFSVFEKYFAEHVFRPYVENELNEWGVATNTITSFDYNESLLAFILSVNWRILAYHIEKGLSDLPAATQKKLTKQENSIRKYLLQECDISGSNSSYLIFLQNLASGSGSLPPRMDPDINFYLLRSVDGTLVTSPNGKTGFAYSKLGPFALITSLIPDSIPKMSPLRVRKKGHISTSQQLTNTDITEFLFIDRPKEVSENLTYSDKQQKQISRAIERNPDRANESMSAKMLISRQLMKDTIEENQR